MTDLTKFREPLMKLLDLVYLIQKDISGVRLRSSIVLRKKEFVNQIDQVIELLNKDVEIVEKGIQNLKKWLFLRKNALNAIKNLYLSIETTLNDSKTDSELKERIRLFVQSAQQEFILSILYLEDLWREVEGTMNSMQKVASIMKVTHEKIDRYKQEYHLDPNEYTSYIDKLFNYLIEEKFDQFNELEKRIRNSILPVKEV
ncbi:MAG: hypothetical protein ACTSPY_11160 [Candidatus Helarchaeota archaeon]